MPGAGNGRHSSIPSGPDGVLPGDLPTLGESPDAVGDGAGDRPGPAHVPQALPAGPRHDPAQPPPHRHRVSQHRSAQQGEDVSRGPHGTAIVRFLNERGLAVSILIYFKN